MKYIVINLPNFHEAKLEQKQRIVAAIVAAVVVAALAVGWYAGIGGFAEWSLFQN